ncbi:hypothetical protein E3N88_43633 [Mikania micrantha]|uniref:Uncharacterized protein n=1 Tax=Mikania micrantha TaxID=192012 RepID=A0A5N6LEI1_9ASTR|nr:hypothetical protein E3N88_43633 [Mikania micrantha]
MPPQHSNNNNNVDDDGDDIPPGFGPGAAASASRDEDDLPEFSFSGRSSGQKIPAQVGFGSKHTQSNPSRPVEQMRQLIHRYGQTANGDDEDDDMPEWQPHHHQNPHAPEGPPAYYMQQPPPSGLLTVNQIRQPIGQVMRPNMTIQPHVNVLQNVVRWPPPSGPPDAAVPGPYYDGRWRSRGF